MKKLGLGFIILSIVLCIATLSMIPSSTVNYDLISLTKYIFFIGLYLLIAILGCTLFLLQAIKNR